MKSLRTLVCFISLLFLIACGEDNSTLDTPVRLALAPALFQGEGPYTLTVTVTGAGMEEMTAETVFTGKQARLEFAAIPSGPNRVFTVEVRDKDGMVLYSGATTQSLIPETPATVLIPTNRTTVPVTLEIKSSGILSQGPYPLIVTVTGEGMEEMTVENTVNAGDTSIKLDVPFGDTRTFIANIMNQRRSVLFSHQTQASLVPGNPLTIPLSIDHVVLSGHDTGSVVRSLSYSPDGRFLAGMSFNTIQVWDMTSFTHMKTLSSDDYTSLSWGPDGRFLASGNDSGIIRVWDTTSFREVKAFEAYVTPPTDGLPGVAGEVTALSYSPNGRHLASAGRRALGFNLLNRDIGTVEVWDMTTFRRVQTLIEREETSIHSLSYSPDGRFLAAGLTFYYLDGSGGVFARLVKVWDMTTFREVKTLEGYSDSVSSLSWSPDGHFLASGDWNGTVKVWDMTTFQEVETLEGHIVSYSPDGRFLATAHSGNQVQIWDLATFQEVKTLKTGDSIGSVSWSPDGRFLASGLSDGTIWVWSTN